MRSNKIVNCGVPKIVKECSIIFVAQQFYHNRPYIFIQITKVEVDMEETERLLVNVVLEEQDSLSNNLRGPTNSTIYSEGSPIKIKELVSIFLREWHLFINLK